MGNIGRSSTGCYLCRKRKIKCDEEKPGCRKCASIRKPCPGYPFSVELALRTTEGQALAADDQPAVRPPRPVRPSFLFQTRSDSRIPQISVSALPGMSEAIHSIEIEVSQMAETHDAPTRSNSVKCEGPSLERRLSLFPAYRSPTPPPKYDVQHQSTCFFLNLFCWQASRLYGASILDYLPEMLLQSDSESCLSLATKAVSRMTLADRYSGCDVRLQTGKEYVKALSATKTTIRNSTEAIKDETFIAVWMLGLYENVNAVLSHGMFDRQHRTPEEEYQSHISHIRGAMNLLRLRGLSQLNKGRSEKIYRIFKAAIQMRLFNLNSVESDDFDNLEADVYRDEHEFLPSESANKATRYFHTVAQLLERAKYALRKQKQLPRSKDIAAELQSVLDKCEEVDAVMAGWSKNENESGWDIMRVQASTQNSMWALYPSHAMYYFRNFWVFMYWLRFLVARLKLYEGMIVVVQRQKAAASMLDKSSATDRIEENATPSLATKPTLVRRQSTNHMDFKIQQYRTVVQLTAGQLIGLTAYALGDVTNTGTFYSSSTSAEEANVASREVNVIGGLQLVIPLKVLQRSDSPTPVQKGAIDLALGHIGDGFRRQPVLV